MFCWDESKCFTATWKIDDFRKYSSPKIRQPIRSSCLKTEDTEGSRLWRFYASHCDWDLKFALVSDMFVKRRRDYRYEMCLLTSCGEVRLSPELTNYGCWCKIRKHTIFGGKKHSHFLLEPQGTLTLSCRIWKETLSPGSCLVLTSLQEVNFPWIVEQFTCLDSDSNQHSLYQQGATQLLLNMVLQKKTTENSTHVRVEVLPGSGSRSSFMSCNLSISEGCGQVVSDNFTASYGIWGWDIAIFPEKFTGDNLHLEIESLIAVDAEHQQRLMPPDASLTFSNTVWDEILRRFKTKTLDYTSLNFKTEFVRDVLTPSKMLRAIFENDQRIKGRSAVVDEEDFDMETHQAKLRDFTYLTSPEDQQWLSASKPYYAADKYSSYSFFTKYAGHLDEDVLSTDNVCEALTSADKYEDEQLMLGSVNFVRDHKEVLSSSAWENLEENHPRLAAKVLRQVIQNK